MHLGSLTALSPDVLGVKLSVMSPVELIRKTVHLEKECVWVSMTYNSVQALSSVLRILSFVKNIVKFTLKGQYHAIFSNTLKIEKTLFG